MTARSIALFIAAALAEIGGAYLVWVGLRDDKGALVVALGVMALGLCGVVAALQPETSSGASRRLRRSVHRRHDRLGYRL